MNYLHFLSKTQRENMRIRDYDEAEYTPKKRDLSELSKVLRNKELWPKDFVWNYNDCEMCAMGLAQALWTEQIRRLNSYEMSAAFDIPWEVAEEIFFNLSDNIDEIITPEQVADAIDLYLSKQK
jgi:hypothetical protein